MTGGPRGPSPSGRTFAAVMTGGAVGFFVAAVAFAVASTRQPQRTAGETGTAPKSAATVELFRLSSRDGHEMMLVAAGPDAAGEPRLSAALFPGETPPRELASLYVANLGTSEPWTVDLTERPLRCRSSDGAVWEPLRSVDPAGVRLAPADALRARGLGGGAERLTVAASSLRQVLVALPPGRRIDELSDVQWGEERLTRDDMDLESVRRFREDPAAAVRGR